MTTSLSLSTIAGYWSEALGVPVTDLQRGGVHIVPHGPSLQGYYGAHLFRRYNTLIISLPPSLIPSYRQRLDQQRDLFSRSALENIFSGRVDRIIGPAWLGYVDGSDFHLTELHGVRLLGEADRPLLDALRLAVGEEAWEHSGIEIGGDMVMGYVQSGRVLAAGRLEPRGPHILDVGIVTDPEWRGRGLGRLVVSALTAASLKQGKIAQYRTLSANHPSLIIARALGYQRYAETFAVRLCEKQV